MGLITVEEARDYLPAVTGSGSDAAIGRVIDRASSALAAHLGYPQRTAALGPTLESYSYTLYSGGGVLVAADGLSLRLAARPITSITSIYDDPSALAYGASTLISSGDYSYDGVEGLIYLLPTRSHAAFSQSYRAVRVIATCGWTTIPDPLREACIRTVQAWWVDRRASAHQDASTPRVDGWDLPEAARRLAGPYRFATGWVS